MRSALAMLLALALGAACSVLVACGGGGDQAGLIPSARADAMQRELDRLDRAVRNGDCASVSPALSTLQDEVNGLPSAVDSKLRSRLQEGVGNLSDIAEQECSDQQTTETTTTETTTTPSTVQTTTTPPETTPTTTTPPPTQTTPPPTQTTTPPTESTPPPVETIPDSGGGATVPPSGGAGGDGGTGGAQPTP